MWGYHNGMGWWMVMGGIWTILLWAVVIGLVVLVGESLERCRRLVDHTVT